MDRAANAKEQHSEVKCHRAPRGDVYLRANGSVVYVVLEE